MNPIGKVTKGRKEPTDDYWGDSAAVIELDRAQFDETAVLGLDTFSHIEVIFQFHLAKESEVTTGASHPRGNPKWPLTGIFAQRKKDRPNHIGVSICELQKLEGLKLHVLGLDAIEGTPILDIKPVIKGFLPDKKSIREPKWAEELMCAYFKTKRE